MKKYEPHPYSELFPEVPISGPEWEEFKLDVCQTQREAIYLYEGKILDGRRRYRALTESGREPAFAPFIGTKRAALDFSYSKNMHHRHLEPGQKASAALKYQEELKKLALEAQREGQQKGGKTAGRGRKKDNSSGTNLSQSYREPDSREIAAKKAGVSEGTLQNASKVSSSGVPELRSLVESGQVAVSAAAEVASLPVKEQEEIVRKGPDEVKKTASRIRQSKKTILQRLLDLWEKASEEEREQFVYDNRASLERVFAILNQG